MCHARLVWSNQDSSQELKLKSYKLNSVNTKIHKVMGHLPCKFIVFYLTFVLNIVEIRIC